MTRRGIEVSTQSAVPVRGVIGEDPVRNEERFRAQVMDLLRQRDGEIDDLLRRVVAIDAAIDLLIGSSGGGGSLPNGGTEGQVLTKQSNADGDAAWESVVIDGGGA
jgi:hypothetical protein